MLEYEPILINYILSPEASIGLSIMAFFLAGLYLLQAHLGLTVAEYNSTVRTERLLVRAMNWAIFGGVFLFFGELLPYKDILAWRATARLALLFLMLSETAYQFTVLWPRIKKRMPWKISTQHC